LHPLFCLALFVIEVLSYGKKIPLLLFQ
jgi:hypothetical protein